MRNQHAVPADYRQSHVNPGRGFFYDRLYSPGTALNFYWQHFERPYLASRFATIASEHPDGRYLDFACGTGRILSVGAGYFRDATGIDVSPAMSSLARAKVPSATILEADVLTEDLDLQAFHVATLFRFLVRAGHLREGVLRWLRGVIADDGVLIVNNHRNANSIRGYAYRLRRLLGRSSAPPEILSDEEVRALVRTTGFEPVEDFAFGYIPSFRGHLLLPQRILLPLERRLASSPRLRRFAKNRIYICRPRSRIA